MLSENNDFEQEFIDQSWSKVKDLLDRDMPVQKKKNETGLFLLFFSLMFVVLLILSINSSQQVKNNQVALYDTKIEASTDLQPQSSGQITGSNVNFEASKQNISVTDNKVKLDRAVIDTPIAQETYAQKTVTESNVTEEIIFTDVRHSQSESFRPVAQSKNLDSKAIIEKVLLPSIDIQLKRNESYLNIDQGTFTKTKELLNGNILDFGIGIIGVSTFNRDFVGVGGSLDFAFQVSGRMRILTGVQLSFLNRHVNPNRTFSDPLYGPSGGNLGALSHYNNLKKYIDVSIPIGIAYSLTNKFSVKAFANMRTALSQTVYGTPFAIQDRSIAIADNYNKFSINPGIGMAFQISKMLSIDSQFELASRSLINNEYYPTEVKKLHHLQMGLHIKL